MQKVAIVTLGCPKNQVDSEAMAAHLTEQGFRLTDDPSGADAIIVNTCGFIQPAREESLEELRRLAARRTRSQLLVAAGCLAELNPELLLETVPGLDGILSTRRWHEAGPFLALLRQRQEPLVWTGDSTTAAPDLRRRPAGATAYVKIAEGCSGPCGFCTIPRIKGPYRSRPLHQIVDEVVDLAGHGYKEIVLVAQDSTAYGRDRGENDGLAVLLETILEAAPALPWVRLMYAYPQHVTDRLIETMATHRQVCRYFDLPLQHAHPDVLRRMRRPPDVDTVVRLIERIRVAMPDVALRTAFIVGYPGETEAEFEALLRFVADMRFDHVGAFVYSPEPGTYAYTLQPWVPDPVKEERRGLLLETQQSISLEIHRSLVGREMEVLVEGAGDGISVGRTYRDAPEVDGLAIVRGEFAPGSMLRARVRQALEYDLIMEPIGEG
ncbi:MAG: 30S ribosomal protein S12 methylthiotransferase RimO [Anaerolineae bacterium]|nr:30S ribosomal protein S12 methylthiotransferase RimO [Anaerolineae bacterium]